MILQSISEGIPPPSFLHNQKTKRNADDEDESEGYRIL